MLFGVFKVGREWMCVMSRPCYSSCSVAQSELDDDTASVASTLVSHRLRKSRTGRKARV